MNSIDGKTCEVVEMYNRHPFPLKGNYGNYFSKYVLPLITEIGDVRRILDAGCGTGNISLDISYYLPHASIVAIDLAQNSLDIAIQKAQEKGLENIEFKKVNLLEFDSALGIFDFVYCQGVLHHLSEPLAGLCNLNRYLKPSGYSFIWVYSYLGRTRILDIRSALEILGINELDWQLKLDLANRVDYLFYRRGSYLKRLINILEYLDSEGFYKFFVQCLRKLRSKFETGDKSILTNVYLADRILHPQDRFYRFSEAIELFSAGGFEFVRVLEGMPDALEKCFNDPEILRIAQRLSPIEQYKLIELYTRPTGIGYLVRKKREV